MADPLPDVGYWADLDLARSESASRSGNRLTNVVEFADPVWMANVATAPMTEADFRGFEAWRDGLRGSLRPVLYRHPSYTGPRGHVASSAPATQAGTVSTVTNGNVVRITGVHSALVLSRGDFVTLEQGALRGLARIVAVSGAGTVRTVTVEPVFPLHFTTGAVARFDRAELVMRMVPGSWSKSRVQDVAWQGSFQLMESRT